MNPEKVEFGSFALSGWFWLGGWCMESVNPKELAEAGLVWFPPAEGSCPDAIPYWLSGSRSPAVDCGGAPNVGIGMIGCRSREESAVDGGEVWRLEGCREYMILRS